jgi:cell division protease FtsH
VKPKPFSNVWSVVFACSCLFILQVLWAQSMPAVEPIPYSEFQTYLKEGRIAEVHVSSERIEGAFKEPLANGAKLFVTNRVEPELAAELSSQKVTFSSERGNSWWTSLAS